jgi:recombination protein RecT
LLWSKLEEESSALPPQLNSFRFKQNAMCAVQKLDFSKINANQKGNFVRAILQGAYLGLDFMNKECYIVPRSGEPLFMTDYKGEKKLCYEYAVRPIKNIYADVVKKGDAFKMTIENNQTKINFEPDPFNDNEIVGAFAVVEYEDGTVNAERMTRKEIEKVREKSLAKKGGPWFDSYGEMCKKTVIRRLTKHIQLKFNDKQMSAWQEGSAMDFEKPTFEGTKDKVNDEIEEVINEPAEEMSFTDAEYKEV